MIAGSSPSAGDFDGIFKDKQTGRLSPTETDYHCTSIILKVLPVLIGMEPNDEEVDLKGLLLKRKDFLGVDERAQSHPNRTYYYKRYHDMDGVIETCTKKLQVTRNQ